MWRLGDDIIILFEPGDRLLREVYGTTVFMRERFSFGKYFPHFVLIFVLVVLTQMKMHITLLENDVLLKFWTWEIWILSLRRLFFNFKCHIRYLGFVLSHNSAWGMRRPLQQVVIYGLRLTCWGYILHTSCNNARLPKILSVEVLLTSAISK